MKLRSTTSAKMSFTKRLLIVLGVVTVGFAAPIQITQNVFANPYDSRIQALQEDIDAYQQKATELSSQKRTLGNELEKLSNEKNTIQAQVDVSQAKYDQLVLQIKETEQRIKDNQDALGETIADLYVDDNISPIEMLASSGTIGDFLDKQEYRISIRDQLASTITKIKDLKKELETQKQDVERVLADQKVQRDALAAKEAERQNLLDKTRGEESAFQALISEKSQELDKLKDEQAAYFTRLTASTNASIVAGDSNKGGYPAYLANNAQDSLVDPWGMYNRECVSYTAWKVHQAYSNMPYWGGIGNAWQWAFSGWTFPDGDFRRGQKAAYNTGVWHTSNAQTRGIPSGVEPREGSVAVKDAIPSQGDYWGHTAWVEEVMGDQIRVSQYNYYNAGGPGWGHYSEMVVHKSFFQNYSYFG